MDDGPQKQAVIDKMVRILQEDSPWSFGFYPYASAAVHGWIKNSKPAILIRDHGRYLRLDAEQRSAALIDWNRPVWWPLLALVAVVAGAIAIARKALKKRERMNARGEILA